MKDQNTNILAFLKVVPKLKEIHKCVIAQLSYKFDVRPQNLAILIELSILFNGNIWSNN
ncbi:MAG: hypothetical protein SFY32_11680 [Bacteroidota bacterium]|nr:hypothetical protein [Bacteroidota bacterium]